MTIAAEASQFTLRQMCNRRGHGRTSASAHRPSPGSQSSQVLVSVTAAQAANCYQGLKLGRTWSRGALLPVGNALARDAYELAVGCSGETKFGPVGGESASTEAARRSALLARRCRYLRLNFR